MSTYYAYADLYISDEGNFFIFQQSYHYSDKPIENIVATDKKGAYDFLISIKENDVCLMSGEIEETAKEYFEI
jgi:hypothetical protein